MGTDAFTRHPQLEAGGGISAKSIAIGQHQQELS
jgi:hypothetical protein